VNPGFIHGTYRAEVLGTVRDRYLSIGEREGVYVFDREGQKTCRERGQEIPW